ncbi:hypothetical protein CWI42_030290 [Ordospora colligata]|uniref:SKI-interacting protein SKIP SNW domain-containing protein n=1 Tax=Ordospora colligata OC4 TaxID=1354746 RepID=A0A0B2ULK3_9MICR|nr:uncharacterized protein M896_031480 [Ordospora colligata OC4]KHN70159.1 hypothetical protein M896_031480 [Ordospora colligata OC4]TBU16541.1 hypothetical protein CWI41_031440 [Ordospora colligata]TBU16582.1 hypothetical protein CWI40_030360 [Ordospora colligata]TBU19155.1 hypothetical protein CWI42_030290 [Ordospora colligata]
MGTKRMNDTENKQMIVKPDPLRVVCKRISKQKNMVREDKRMLIKNKSKVKLFKCMSMWKNPTSQIVPLQTRVVHDRFKTVHQEINIEMFMNLKYSLDQIEAQYTSNCLDTQEDINNIDKFHTSNN